jgi:hypothetical protein
MTLSTVVAATLAVAVIVVAVVLLVLRDVAGALATDEARAWLPRLSRRIVQRSVRALPPDQRDILEDMESQLSERSDRPITMLLFAFRIARRRRLIAAEERKLTSESNAPVAYRRPLTVPLPIAGAARLIRTALIAVRASANRLDGVRRLWFRAVQVLSTGSLYHRKFDLVLLIVFLLCVAAGIEVVHLISSTAIESLREAHL